MTHTIHASASDSAGDGQRPCARGNHCAGRRVVIDGGERIVVPAPTYRTFCEADRSRIVNCLGELPDMFVQLDGRIGERRQTDGPRVSGGSGSGSRLPVNENTEAFLRLTVEVMVSWEERVRTLAKLAEMDTQLARRRRQKVAVAAACTVLSAHVDALLGLVPDRMYRTADIARSERLPQDATGLVHPSGGWIEYFTDLGGVDAGREVLNLHHQFLARLGMTPKHHDLYTKCWECELPRLRRWDGTVGLADHVECRGCGEQYLGDRLKRLMVEEDNTVRRRAVKQAS